MTIYTMGFTQKSAQQFFELIAANKIDLLIDIRLNNASQLAGFAKGRDLEYFLHTISNCGYEHRVDFAPTKELMEDYKKKRISWQTYEVQYHALMEERDTYRQLIHDYTNHEAICLLCSEPKGEHCHRVLLANLLQHTFPELKVVHL